MAAKSQNPKRWERHGDAMLLRDSKGVTWAFLVLEAGLYRAVVYGNAVSGNDGWTDHSGRNKRNLMKLARWLVERREGRF